MSRAAFTAEDILAQLDDCVAAYAFPMLDHPYNYLGDVRLSGYADATRWALVIEALGYNPRAFGALNKLYHFGNCLRGRAGVENGDFLSPAVAFERAGAEEEWEDEGHVPEGVEQVLIRGEPVPIPRAPEVLAAKGIELQEPPRLRPEELLRALLPEHRDRLLATEEERRRRIPPDLPLVIRLDEWHHPDVGNEERPSECPTFQLIAQVLVTGDPNRYCPTLPPNTHWKNWPEGGTL